MVVEGAGEEAVGGVDEMDESEGVEGGEGPVDADNVRFLTFGFDLVFDAVRREGLIGFG